MFMINVCTRFGFTLFALWRGVNFTLLGLLPCAYFMSRPAEGAMLVHCRTAQMTPLHLLPLLLKTPLTLALKTPPTPSPTALRSLTPQLSAPPLPMAFTQLMASMVLTVMASAANMSGGHQLPMGVLEGTPALGSAPQTSWLMIALGTIVCCCSCCHCCFECICMHCNRCTRLCFVSGLCRQSPLLSGLLGPRCTSSMYILKGVHGEALQCNPPETCASMLHEGLRPSALLAAAVPFAWHAALSLKPILASFAVVILCLIWNHLFTRMC